MKKLIAVSVAVGAFALYCSPAHAYPTTLYTTVEDYSLGNGGGWSGNTAGGSTAWDADGSAVNGTANASAGGAGTAGALEFVPSGSGELGWTALCELYLGSFATAKATIDPGYIDAGTIYPGANGTITMVYTLPDNALGGGGTYFQPMLGFNASWGWSLYGPDSTSSLGIVNGREAYLATFSYSIPSNAGGWGANLQIGANTDYAPIEPFYYDNIVVTDAVPIPEPTSIALLGMGALALGFLVRQTKK